MREKARDLIYLDSQRYLSLSNIRGLYWYVIVFSLVMVILGFAAMNALGVGLISLFPIISNIFLNLFYWIFVLTIQSKRVKKTFELRFLVNGIVGFFLSLFFWAECTSFNLVADEPLIDFTFCLWILFFYLFFSAIYIALVILGVHKGIYRKVKEKGQTPKFLAISALLSAILPFSGALGIFTSKMLRKYATVHVQNISFMICIITLIFVLALSHINFVQYYYCKKYKILCDEHGNTTSPMLEPQVKEKKIKVKKKIPLIIKILIGIVSAPVVLFITVFIVFFIKELIQ